MSGGNFGVQPKHPGVAPSFWITGDHPPGARVHPPTFLHMTCRRERPKVHILQAFTEAQFPLPEASPVGFEWMMDGWIDFFICICRRLGVNNI